MVFGLIRKADDANFQSFEDSGICSFQEERNESLRFATGDIENNGRGHSSSHRICDLLGGLLGDDQLDEDLDEDLLGGSLKNDLIARTRQNLLRAPSLKVETTPPLSNSNNQNHSDGKSSNARNHEFLRAPSMDRENEYVGIIEESNSESSETSDETECGSSSAPVQFELPLDSSIPAHGSSRKSLSCLEGPGDQSSSPANDYNVSITFTTCFDLDDEIEVKSASNQPGHKDLIDLSELEANGVIDKETAKRIREHLNQKKNKKIVPQVSVEKENQNEDTETKGSHRASKRRSPSHNEKTASSKSEERRSGNGSPSLHSDRERGTHLSPDQTRSKGLHDTKYVPSRRSPRKNEGKDDANSHSGSKEEEGNHRVERRKSNHLPSDSEHLSKTRVSPERRRSKESSPSHSGQTKVHSEEFENELCENNVDEKKRKSLLGSPGKMVMKFLSQRNVTDDKERPAVKRCESQTEIGSSLSEVGETKLRSQSHGLNLQSDIDRIQNESIDENVILDCSNRSSPKSSTRFANWILNGRRPSITNAGEIEEKEVKVSNLDTRRSSAKEAEISDLVLEPSKATAKIDNHFRQRHMISDSYVQDSPSKIRPAIMRSSSLDVLYSPVRNLMTPEMQKFGADDKDSVNEQTETISSLKRGKPTRRRSISVGANTDDKRRVQNDLEPAESSIEKVVVQKKREQSISPTKRSSLSAASKHKKELSQTQHPHDRQVSASGTRTAKARDLSNSCHVLKSEISSRNESTTQRSPGSRPLSKKHETPETPSKRRSSLTHQKGLSFSVYVSPTKRKSSTVVTRRLSALASVPVVDPPLHSAKTTLTSAVGPGTTTNDNNPLSTSELSVRSGNRKINIASPEHDNTEDVRNQRVMSQSVHLSPTKRKNGLNVGASRANKTHGTLETTSSYKVKVPTDTVLSPDLSYPSSASKSANGSTGTQASTRTRKATVDDLKKELEHPGDNEVDENGCKNLQKIGSRKIHIFSSKRVS